MVTGGREVSLGAVLIDFVNSASIYSKILEDIYQYISTYVHILEDIHIKQGTVCSMTAL